MLYIVATPIGNMEDITYRAVRILGEVDFIYAEDTRRTLSLLRHFGIKTQVLSCHEHNERERCNEILEKLSAGQNIALVSDAGLPGVSDPGAIILRATVNAGLEATVLPGASAATTAWVLSAIEGERFAFEGFLPRDKKHRSARIEALKRQENTIIIYESPLRLRSTLSELHSALGDRKAAVCRELTKLFESCVRAELSELISHYSEPPKGECVIVVQGMTFVPGETPSLEQLLENLADLIEGGAHAKSAAKQLATEQFSANVIYNAYIKSKNF